MSDISQGPTTPNRTTVLTLDIDDPVLIEPAVSHTRMGLEVAKPSGLGFADLINHLGVSFAAKPGCWALSVLQSEISNLQEKLEGDTLIIPASSYNLAQLVSLQSGLSAVAVVNEWRQYSDLPGMDFDQTIRKAGDPFLIKQIPASAKDWKTYINSSVPAPGQIDVAIPLDRLAEGNVTYPYDQGFFLRWVLPGTSNQYPGYIWTFYFGQYAVSIKGSGKATLFEYCLDSTGAYQWRQRSAFRYKPPNQISDTAQTLLIWPHVNPVDVRPNEQGLRRVGDLVRGLIAKRASLAPLVGPRRVQAVFKEGRLAAALDGDGVLPEVERPDVARVLIGSAGQDPSEEEALVVGIGNVAFGKPIQGDRYVNLAGRRDAGIDVGFPVFCTRRNLLDEERIARLADRLIEVHAGKIGVLSPFVDDGDGG